MKTATFLFAALLLATAASAALADDRAAIEDFVVRYDRAFVAGDVPAAEAMLADDYSVVVEGRTSDRASALNEFRGMAKDDRPTALSSKVERVIADGNLAVAVGQIEVTQDGRLSREHFTLVLRRDGGVWQAVSEHISDVASE